MDIHARLPVLVFGVGSGAMPGTSSAGRLAERRKLADHKSDEFQAAII
jgi:hypothetical protein